MFVQLTPHLHNLDFYSNQCVIDALRLWFKQKKTKEQQKTQIFLRLHLNYEFVFDLFDQKTSINMIDQSIGSLTHFPHERTKNILCKQLNIIFTHNRTHPARLS